MLAPLSWLKEYVDITLPVEALAERLTLAGLAVDAIHRIGDWWDPETIVVGQVVAVLPHPDADRLVLVDVDYGGDAPQRVVTGAPNLFQFRGVETLPTLKVAFARAGAVLVDAYSAERPRPKKKLKPTKIRGVESAGMVCSERELGLSEEHEGILLLPEDAPVGTPLHDYLGDLVLEFDFTPDMARALSMIGVAREISALTEARLHLPPDVFPAEGEDRVEEYVAVRIEEPTLCNRYTGVVIRDVTVGPSPKWMQDRLIKAGMRPINNIVDITNYVMLEYGQPLHAFDYDVLVRRAQRAGERIPTIIVRRANDGEKFVTLDDVERTLDSEMLMIADALGSIAIAGVMGGQESEVSDKTRNILLESATFEGINNRRTSQKLKLFSAASYRFTRGVPATLNDIAARRAADLMRRYAGGRIVPGLVDAYPVPQRPVVVYTTESDMQRILGMPVTLEQAGEALRRLDFSVRQVAEPDPNAQPEATFALHRRPGEPLLECTVPWHRLDVTIPADLIEETARILGYESVPLTLMEDALPTQHRNEVIETEERIRDILIGCGLQDTINYALTSPENHARLSLTYAPLHASADGALIELANPIAAERRVMRRSLLVSALESLQYNLRYADRLAMFEIGRVYLPELGDGVLPYEDRRLSLVMVGPRQPQDFYATSREEMDFFDLKGVLETLLERLGFKREAVEYRPLHNVGAFGPRCAEVVIDGEIAGLFGEVHPQVRAAFDLPAVRVNAAELRIERLLRPHWRFDPVPPISPYPPVVEDLAFIVDEAVPVRAVENAIRAAGGALLTDVALFDLYRGEPLPPGAKSLAFRLTYQSQEASLRDADVAKLRERIIRRVEREVGGKLRG
ncbi:phenylalanine--tRNA ligase subunit beta [Caldilinea sp.]|uniref:phenylalanine--tRNA ligase subunit beta n=1 Tax=Caldilinea sp. TaxID=2293560 RepID=UPI0021DDAD1E|nr:phenylalanine--tRNA ligase subunit beta [Caldilinea sp.]GIV70889.1 MAG: phenylalanine--tRNA ligase beta subunit [Caldilinea sp.]